MKNVLKYLVIIISMTCAAQNPVINIKDQFVSDIINGAYYKDVDNLLSPFQGEYVFSNGGTYLKIVLQKKVLADNGNYYEDLMIGEYEYKENNITKANTLSKLNGNLPYKLMHIIHGNSILKKSNKPPCPDCGVDEKRLSLGILEGSAYGTIAIRKIIHNGQEAIKMHIRQTSNNLMSSRNSGLVQINGTVSTPSYLSIPNGYYILIKQ
ncbi:DUF6705 family protein [Flavobacterium sp.]|uniref:DUF6705 family protein n=1 Tax=Flavobacterium sp. TaxID=239 RepID=UPI00286E040A|nr:DUF6705 family protein [Flavobacterium sp.]